MESIIITGATSGIGFECAMQMAKIAPNDQIVIACRNLVSGNKVTQNIKQKTGHKNLICMLLDLESLQSVREFATQFSKQPNNKIIALINNAGIQNVAETQFTKEGFEVTFGVNHLATTYLTLLLLPLMDSNASITFTASGTHDPKQKTGMEPPIFKSASELAHPTETNEKRMAVGQRRYTTSKLCNILTTYELQRKLSETNIRVNAFDPGFVPGTGLARNYPPFLRFISNKILPVLRFFVHNVNTAPVSGKRLANLAYADQYKNYKGKYFEGAKEIKSSTDSYNKEYQDILWTSTIGLLKIKQDETSVQLA
ncbi:SDR family NAD(P)-dependent oxidoreductase [uncultured Mucilaginibacter sp.]|uniref:SDR family NAD(P)-dependent oxidoreductase n=1 Tax=uncultured Mucilaginibacter sp. TaxID=797541 RepID=UPI0026182858|nr:SDR family NAD(P)-dependent oxidoreductase [uncultured Mucilaginibacter sp.]